MHILVTYDVSTLTAEGRRRLRRVARACEDYGIRVQNSVFELSLEPDKWVECKNRLLSEIDQAQDSLRFYFLGSNWRRRVEHIGAKEALDVEGPLIL